MKSSVIKDYQQDVIELLQDKLSAIRSQINGTFNEYRLLAVTEACDALNSTERRRLKSKMRRLEWDIWHLHDIYRITGTMRLNACNDTQASSLSLVSQ